MRVLLLFVVLVLCAGVSLSQTVDQDDVIRVETDVTNLPFTATDKQHRFVTTLRAEDMRVLEDGVTQTLFTFQRETDRPLAIAFLIDVSISQESTLPDEKAAARTFIEKVIESNKDQVAIVPFTGLAAPPAEGTTAIWDAVALTSSNVLAKAGALRRRAIILLTDGINTTGRL